MMGLIDADKLYKHKFKSTSERMDLDVEYMFGWNDAIDAIVENAPTVEQKHGHWIDDWDIGCSVCSECDDSFLWEDFNGVREFNYCPTCGAKMDEVEDV